MILSARRCSTSSALTEAPATSGVPVEISAPSPTISTSPSSIVAPGSPTSFSTAIRSFGATLYCLPPVRMIANMTKTDIGCRARPDKSDLASPAWREFHRRTGGPVREPRNIGARPVLSTDLVCQRDWPVRGLRPPSRAAAPLQFGRDLAQNLAQPSDGWLVAVFAVPQRHHVEGRRCIGRIEQR